MQGRLTIRASTLAHNDAVGGIDEVPDHAKGMGGAVFNLSGTVTADDSTFAANDATFDGASIYNLVYDGHTARTALTTLRDTIVADGIGGPDVVSNKTAYISPPNLGSATVDVSQFDLVTAMVAREQGAIVGSPLTATRCSARCVTTAARPRRSLPPEEPGHRRRLRVRAGHR